MKKSIIRLMIVLLAITFLISGCAGKTADQKKDFKTIELSDMILDQAKVDENLKKEVEAKHSFDEPFVAVNPYGIAPLSAVVIFNTEEETGVSLKVEGKDDSVDIETTFEKNTEHIIPVYGLYEG